VTSEEQGEEQAVKISLVQAIGMLLRCVRLIQGLPLVDLAKDCGVSPSVLSRVEGGKRPPQLSVLMIVCHRLGVRLGDLIDMAENEVAPRGSRDWIDLPQLLAPSFPGSSKPLGRYLHKDASLAHGFAPMTIAAYGETGDNAGPSDLRSVGDQGAGNQEGAAVECARRVKWCEGEHG
jgi:transcriptional regulator with XRE-family HTH domain